MTHSNITRRGTISGIAVGVGLDAFMPSDGQKPLDFTNEVFRKIAQTAIDKSESGFAPPPKTPPVFVAECDQAFVDSKLTPHPIGTYLQPACFAATAVGVPPTIITSTLSRMNSATIST
jgi:hypothetical protein